LWAIVRRTLLLDYFRGQFEGVAGVLALGGALIWAVHPLNTESVAYVTQRTESMMGFFYLATFYAALRYWNAKVPFSRAAWLLVATATSVLGMLSKEMMASAIAMVLLFERTFVAGSFRRAWQRSWPLYLGLAVGWLPILAINFHGPRTPLAGFHLGVPAHVWWLTQAKVLLIYLKLALWPWPLVIHYEVPYLESFKAAWPWLLGVALLAGATLAMVWRRTAVGFVGGWLFAVLSPTLLIPMPGETLAERRMYVPLMAIVPLAVVGGFALFEWLVQRFTSNTIRPRPSRTALAATAAATLALAAVFSMVSIRRLAAYRTELAVWQDAATYQPHDPLVQINLGTALASQGRSAEAIGHFNEALQLDPDPRHAHFSHAHFNLGRALAEMGRPREALEHYEQAVHAEPGFADAQYNFALSLSSAGRTGEAIEHFREAVRARPDFAAAHNNLAIALAGTGRTAEAISHFERALKFEPDCEGFANLAFAYALMNRRSEALAAADKAVALARTQGKAGLANELDAWLRSYRAAAQ
jgi:tetratricopeptide (TPR) repeat protein